MGDLAIIEPPRKTPFLWCLAALLMLLLAFMIYYWPATQTTTAEPRGMLIPIPEAVSNTIMPVAKAPLNSTCIIWGDPHFVTFDKARPSFYGEGETWIVKSDTVHIQGRFFGTKYTDGLAATNKIVVGGPSLRGHKIEVGSLRSGHPIVDGKPVLEHLNFSHSVEGLFTLTYDAQGKLIDEKQASFGKHIVHMDLPHGVRVTVDRWINYIDLKIEMQQQPGQDG